MRCPTCGDLYAYHDEHLYSCPQGHTWRPCLLCAQPAVESTLCPVAHDGEHRPTL